MRIGANRHGSSIRLLLIVVAWMAIAFGTRAGDFKNLDFEMATIPPPFPGDLHLVDGALAVPGWEVFGNAVLYNNLTLGSPVVILTGPGYPEFMKPPLQGLYTPRLHYGPTNPFGGPFLSQVGMVPQDAVWMTFLFDVGANFRVTLGGQEIPVFPVGNGRMAGDVSAFAGQEVELKFATYFVNNEGSGLIFDDITFEPTPEPAIGGLLLVGGWLTQRRLRNRHP